MTQVTLKKVFSSVKTTKFGDKLSVGLKIEEPTVLDINGETVTVGDKYLNAWFDKNFTFPFHEGEKVDLLISTRGEYIDFKIPGVGKPPEVNTSALIERIIKLENAVFGGTATSKSESITPADEPVDPNDF